MERGGTVHIPEARGRVGREGRGAEEVHAVVVASGVVRQAGPANWRL